MRCGGTGGGSCRGGGSSSGTSPSGSSSSKHDRCTAFDGDKSNCKQHSDSNSNGDCRSSWISSGVGGIGSGNTSDTSSRGRDAWLQARNRARRKAKLQAKQDAAAQGRR